MVGADGTDSLLGGNGSDTLIGGDGNDTLIGGAGDDLIDASGGSRSSQPFGDWIQAGTGSNTIIGHADLFLNGRDGIDIGWGDVTGSGGLRILVGANGTGTAQSNVAGVVNDTFTYAQRFDGTRDADSMRGSDNPNLEQWNGGNGADTMDGGGGLDELLYHLDSQRGGAGAVTVNFATGEATDPWGAADRFSNMERVRGTPGSDVFTGNADIGTIQYRGLEGQDTINGTAGWDIADHSQDAQFGGGAYYFRICE